MLMRRRGSRASIRLAGLGRRGRAWRLWGVWRAGLGRRWWMGSSLPLWYRFLKAVRRTLAVHVLLRRRRSNDQTTGAKFSGVLRERPLTMFPLVTYSFNQFLRVVSSILPIRPRLQDLGAKVISYCNSNFASGSPSRGSKVTLNSFLTANTLSSARYLQSLSKICVVRCL
jgi:hypothetical protein